METVIEFENPELRTDNQGENWIKLNKTDCSGGRLSRPINNSDLWGRVKGDMIDIPLKGENGNPFNLKMEVFQENPDGSEKKILEDLKNNRLTLPIPNTTNNNFIMHYEGGKNFIQFSLDNGYDAVNDKNKEIKFYIRYYDLTTQKFLFDQRYIVRFKDEVNYLADSTLKIKNPAMVSENDNKGRVILKGNGEDVGENNNKTFDSIVWYEVQNGINYKEKIQMHGHLFLKK